MTKIKKRKLMNAILSMAHPKVKILRKSPNNKECEDWHKFQINSRFYHNRARIVVPTMDVVDGKEEEKMENWDDVNIDKTKNLATVKVLDINVVMSWEPRLHNDFCEICEHRLHDLCGSCMLPSVDADIMKECTLAWGCCNHQFHYHCMARRLKYRATTCPTCSMKWEFQAFDEL